MVVLASTYLTASSVLVQICTPARAVSTMLAIPALTTPAKMEALATKWVRPTSRAPARTVTGESSARLQLTVLVSLTLVSMAVAVLAQAGGNTFASVL